MTWSVIDRLIDREVGELCWHLLPALNPDLEGCVRSERFQSIWDRRDDAELIRVAYDDPIVPYPVLLLDSDRGLNCLSGLIYPPRNGAFLRLSDYLTHLRRFLILQLTVGEEATSRLITRAIGEFAQHASAADLLELVDQLWRGRWIVGSFEWGAFRLSVLAGGQNEAIAQLQADKDRLQAEAVRIVQLERKLKDEASCIEEWLFGIYSLLPVVHCVLTALRTSNETFPSDEVEKFDRVLDEFQADIATTLQIAYENSGHLFDIYIREPLEKSGDIEDASKQIRGTYRGRTIIPRVWYEEVAAAAKDQSVSSQVGGASPGVDLADWIMLHISTPDCLSCFGRAVTIDRDPWMALLHIEAAGH